MFWESVEIVLILEVLEGFVWSMANRAYNLMNLLSAIIHLNPQLFKHLSTRENALI